VPASETNLQVCPVCDFLKPCLLTHCYSWPLALPSALTLPHLFKRKGNWFQTKELGNVLLNLAEAKSLLA